MLVLVGPTAGGKTALSITLAERLPGGGECISADSMQVYRGMDIGTAKPTMPERRGIPHHGLDLVDPSDDGFTVDRWRSHAEAAIAAARARGRWPIVVGGTNLYVQALLFGLFAGPEADPALRAALEGATLEALRARLLAVDPDAADRIHPADRRRTVRALEVHAATGRPISHLQREWMSAPRTDAIVVGLEWPAEAINPRINARVRGMFESGLVDEVRGLRSRPGGLGRQARSALGYRQVLAALDGSISMDEAIESTKIETRRFAKQQRTWLRRFRVLPRSWWLQAAEMSPEDLVIESLAAVAADAFPPPADAPRA